MDLSVISSEICQNDNIIYQWLKDSEISENSRKTYKKGINVFIEYLKSNNLVSSRSSIIDFKNFAMEKYSNSSAYIYLASIKSLYRYLERSYGIINVARDVKLPKIPKGFKKDCLSLDQVYLLLDSLEENTLKQMRDKVMINLFIRCGLRCCELINANVEDIHTLEGNKVLYVKGKGHDDKDEYVVLTNYLLKLIDKYLNMRRDYIDKSPLLASCGNKSYGLKLDSSTVRRICKEYLKNIGICSSRISTHSFRHTSITLSVMAGSSLLDVKDYARHTSIDTTLKYIHNLKRLENAPELKLDELLNKSKKDENNS